MNHYSSSIFAIIVALILPVGAMAGQCDAHFTFDGDLQDTGGNGYHGQMIGKDGASATPRFVEGKQGRALELVGDSAMRSFLDLHFDTCPQVTVTAWIQVTGTERKGIQYLFSTGSGIGPGIRVSGTNLMLRGSANGIIQRDAIRANAGWMFVAGAYDYKNGIYTLYSRNRIVDKEMGESRKAPEEAIWVGAFNDGLAGPAAGILIDDLRIYGQVLSADELRAAQIKAAAAPGTETQVATTTPTSDALPTCSTQSDCSPGNYCAWDNTCHPESHAPKQMFEVMQAPPVEGFILDENARLTDEEGSSESDSPPADAPVAAIVAPHPAGAPRESALAGFGGDIQRRIDLGDSFLSKIKWDQPGDRPCHIVIGGDDESFGRAEFACGTGSIGQISPPPPLNYADADFEREVRLRNGVIVRITVCNNQRNHRLKGIRIWGQTINPDGTTIYQSETDSEEFPNCGGWSSSVLCPTDHVATGLVVEANDLGGDNRAEIVGLRLICRRISVEG